MDRRNEPQPASDEEITAMFRTRDERAPEFAMQKYGRLMLAAAERVLHSPQDSEECVDDALLSLWNAFPDYGEINLPALLAVSARRAALNRFNSDLRRQGAAERRTLPLDELYEELHTPGAEEEYISAEFGGVLSEFLRGLDKRRRRIFLARYYESRSHAEIAEQLGISASAVNKSLIKTKKELAAFLKKRGIMI